MTHGGAQQKSHDKVTHERGSLFVRAITLETECERVDKYPSLTEDGYESSMLSRYVLDASVGNCELSDSDARRLTCVSTPKGGYISGTHVHGLCVRS